MYYVSRGCCVEAPQLGLSLWKISMSMLGDLQMHDIFKLRIVVIKKLQSQSGLRYMI